MKYRKWVSVLTALVMTLVLLPVGTSGAANDAASKGLSTLTYINEDGEEDSVGLWYCIENSDNKEGFGMGTYRWYGVEGDVTIDHQIEVNGDVHLVLCDGATLTVNGGFYIHSTLSIYQQKNGTGQLNVSGSGDVSNRYNDGIGGANVCIYGGTVNAAGGSNGAGIGCWERIVIAGGTVTATGGRFAAGIGGDASEVVISGGKVTANGGQYSAGIGANSLGTCGKVTISGGTVEANGGSGGAGIGGCESGDGGRIVISDGSVTAKGGEDGGAGIGGGWSGSCGEILIMNGKVEASGGDSGQNSGAGIGNGAKRSGDTGSVTIYGGEVKAIGGGTSGAGIGGGAESVGCDVSIYGGTVIAQSAYDRNAIGSGLGSNEQGTLQFGYVRAYLRLEEPYSYRLSDQRYNACHEAYVKLETCDPHGPSDYGMCPYCDMGNAPVRYLDPTGETPEEKSCPAYGCLYNQTTLTSGWYIVNENVQIDSRITVEGDVHLILCDNRTLTATGGFRVADGSSLTFWAQSKYDYSHFSQGKLTVAAPGDCNAGIGGNDTEDGGHITVNGGILTVNGGYKSAAIGGGRNGAGGTITFNGGETTANGADYGTGIGGGTAINQSTTGGGAGLITVNGGTVTANGGKNGAGIGTGGGISEGHGNIGYGSVTINGGTVTATGGSCSAGIGGSAFSSGCSVTLVDGTVTAIGKSGGAGVGGGEYGNGGNVYVSGGTLIVRGYQAIGKGYSGEIDGGLMLGGIRVYDSETSETPVAYAKRYDTCRSGWAKLTLCDPHGYDLSPFCPYCGGIVSGMEQFVCGDANDDGIITAADAAIILRALVGMSELCDHGRLNADVDGDGAITAADAAMILRFVVGLIQTFPVQQP